MSIYIFVTILLLVGITSIITTWIWCKYVLDSRYHDRMREIENREADILENISLLNVLLSEEHIKWTNLLDEAIISKYRSSLHYQELYEKLKGSRNE